MSDCIFESRTDVSPPTICKHCGRAKFLHASEIVWDFMGSTIPQPPIELTKMSKKKQSSIDLFAIALYEKGFLKGNGDDINDLLEEHKAMHKEEQEQTWEISWEECSKFDACKNKYNGGFEEYYNETFGGDYERHK